jgi:hypothetical protein
MAKGQFPSYYNLHKEIDSLRDALLSAAPPAGVDPERIVTAVRNLDVAKCLLECNQTLSPTDYNVRPWEHIHDMKKVQASKAAVKKAGANKKK